MIDPSIGKALADLGGFALFLLHISLDAIGLFRQWWVDGEHFREVVRQRDDLKVELAEARSELKEARSTISRQALELARERGRRGVPRVGP